MKLYYIFHRDFVIIEDKVVVIIDFYEDSINDLHGIIHDILVHDFGKIYVLSSHFHSDHFKKQILSWKQQRPDIVYILSRDILRYRRVNKNGIIFLMKGEVYSDDLLKVKAYGSTDSGDSFLITLSGVTFFHAGDLNNWHWADESTPQDIKKAEGDYLAELKYITNDIQFVDVVMFPVDRRLGTDYHQGAKQFLERISARIFVPMHFTYDYEGGNIFQKITEKYGSIFIPIKKKGQEINITRLLELNREL